MERSNLAERFLLALIVMVVVGWVLGLVSAPLALAGPFAAGFIFVRYKAGVVRRNPVNGALLSASAVVLMVTPVVFVSWFLFTATTEPGESATLMEALVDFEGDRDQIVATVIFAAGSIALAGAGGGLAAWLHNRQLDREYWVSEE